jgi:hypothetical protein
MRAFRTITMFMILNKCFKGWDSDFTKFYLVRRRTMCTDCIPVKSRLEMIFDV